MELGKGEWDYNLLIEQFFSHLEKYERIFTLRCITKNNPFWHYELVELPKALLLETTGKEFRVVEQSKQNPKPMYCEVFDESGLLKFALYFDGGTERKLQVQKIDKTYCKLHASWKFHVISEALE